MLLLAHSLIAGALAGQVPPQAVDYRGYAEVVVETTGSRDLETALSLPGRVLNCHVRPGDPLVLLMSSQERAALDVSGLSYRVSVPDAALAWDDVRQRARARRESEPLAPAAWFDDFVELDGIESYLEELRKVAPDRIFVDDIGESFEGRTIKAIRLSNGHGDTDNPAFIVLGTQHAREWLSPMVVMWFADRLAREYGSDSEVTDLLDKMDVIIVPVVNPDGYIYSWDTDRYWRKNRNNVDLNRNWDAGWGIGNGNDPMSAETYPGTGAFSEKETKAVSQYAAGIENLVGYADVHTPISSMLYPRGYTTDEPDEIESLRDWANEAAQAIEGVHGESTQVFRPTSAQDPTGMGPQGGLGMDYMADTIGFGWIFEMRGPDFQIDKSEILPAAEENWAGFMVFAKHLAERFGNDTGGDDTSSGEDSTSTTSTSTSDSSETNSTLSDSEDSTTDSEQSSTGSNSAGDSQTGSTGEQDASTASGADSSGDDSGSSGQKEDGKSSGGCNLPAGGGFGRWWSAGIVGLCFVGNRRKRNPKTS